MGVKIRATFPKVKITLKQQTLDMQRSYET